MVTVQSYGSYENADQLENSGTKKVKRNCTSSTTNDMIFWRFLRRRGFALACKTVLGCSVVFITLQITSTFPRHPSKDHQMAVQANSVKNEEGVVDSEKSQEFVAHQKEAKQAHKSGKLHDPKTQRRRENLFYENIIVHFDLKGAPPRVPYFLQLLDIVAQSGATGVMIEWEDMFPWTGKLEVAKNTDAYSLEDVQEILTKARDLNLDVIPLVQTFGHLEWILKLEHFRKYRENDEYPQVLCVGDEEAVEIVKDALKQVIDVHKSFGIKYFHIGSDEVFEFGVCPKSVEWILKHSIDGDKQLLAVSHMKDIALFVKNLTDGATVLAWHDMLKGFDSRIIASLQLGEVIELVIWDYSEHIVTMPDSSFSDLALNFPVVWASSAYKGANFPSAKYIDIRHYEANNLAWIDTKIAQEVKFANFRGIIITGWQRYDHMATICEILPMGTPSMVLNVQIALMGAKKDPYVARQRAAKVLGCVYFSVHKLNIISNMCNFTGFTAYSLFQGSAQDTISYINSELDRNHQLMGWLSPYNIRHNFTQNWNLKELKPFLEVLLEQILPIDRSLRKELSIYSSLALWMSLCPPQLLPSLIGYKVI
ncbi:hypothetical protein KIN20_001106 [Parelaphostrongylus tenuis]|uniref:beta-N-acetylhexosaminidase n=1 Tax=Parelaphostrongylus tenuis TaxID=148309 RepID=A0AAD5LWI1_PARTN|nr:hypothetical protein KIN20_001106 [Parelaphostrongylus tenuis]